MKLYLSHIDGSTCLHEAAHSGSMEMIALLLSLGANGMKKVQLSLNR